jgi:hypothetical protein
MISGSCGRYSTLTARDHGSGLLTMEEDVPDAKFLLLAGVTVLM